VSGDVVRVWMDRPGSASRRPGPYKSGALDILFEDAALVVLNKPAGLLSVPLERRSQSPSIVTLLEDYFRSSGKRKPFVVHRIDLDTSGLVVFAKTAKAQAALKDQFRRREPERVYLAVVYGHPSQAQGTWRDRLVWDTKALIQKETHPNDPSGMDAVSNYRVVERFAATSLIEVRLETGKRNQIRIQARLRGHTLVGEKRYVYGPDAIRPIVFARQALHAHRLVFRHPADDRRLEFEAPLPPDMSDLLARLRRE
jgi:23S rRNA pseudouridine1911/1915/1917 synthase